VKVTVRYCPTPGGRVAYSTTGTGPALLCDSGWITHLRRQLDLLSFGDTVQRLAEQFTVIRYDKPGCGLSDRDDVDLSVDGQVAAALAVADAVGAPTFRLFGASQAGQIAATIAARHPERVEALVVYGMCASGQDLAPPAVRTSVVDLVRAHWGLGLKALSGAFVSESTPEEDVKFNEFQRASSTAAVAADLLEVYYNTDIRASLPAIRTKTAVLHREGDRGTRFELGREVAALIPGATLIPLPGTSHLYYHGDWESVIDAAVGFLEPAQKPEQLLTDRELEVADLVTDGLTNQAIARRLAVGARTVDTHVENIRRKLGVRSRAQIAAWVTAHGVGSSTDARPAPLGTGRNDTAKHP
jgi:pimeloyl-ACP methyl ester carboxylesterase/DNA-binding CsgD family transcriptional regulator